MKTPANITGEKTGYRTVLVAFVGMLVVAGAMFGFYGQSANNLQRVPADHVCMVNNKYFANPQIPVSVGPKTYFGCCEMCRGRIANDPSVRIATDPVSGTAVDKADAVIGMLPDGSVYYFQSEANLKRYQSSPTS